MVEQSARDGSRSCTAGARLIQTIDSVYNGRNLLENDERDQVQLDRMSRKRIDQANELLNER